MMAVGNVEFSRVLRDNGYFQGFLPRGKVEAEKGKRDRDDAGQIHIPLG